MISTLGGPRRPTSDLLGGTCFLSGFRCGSACLRGPLRDGFFAPQSPLRGGPKPTKSLFSRLSSSTSSPPRPKNNAFQWGILTQTHEWLHPMKTTLERMRFIHNSARLELSPRSDVEPSSKNAEKLGLIRGPRVYFRPPTGTKRNPRGGPNRSNFDSQTIPNVF